ncbi:uncharacterized protein O3C94_013690 [Discoglossus pictus]
MKLILALYVVVGILSLLAEPSQGTNNKPDQKLDKDSYDAHSHPVKLRLKSQKDEGSEIRFDTEKRQLDREGLNKNKNDSNSTSTNQMYPPVSLNLNENIGDSDHRSKVNDTEVSITNKKNDSELGEGQKRALIFSEHNSSLRGFFLAVLHEVIDVLDYITD